MKRLRNVLLFLIGITVLFAIIVGNKLFGPYDVVNK